jgi:hypothetical protein
MARRGGAGPYVTGPILKPVVVYRGLVDKMVRALQLKTKALQPSEDTSADRTSQVRVFVSQSY